MSIDLNSSNMSGERLSWHIDKAVEQERAAERPRNYLGASIIGCECSRALQFEYFRVPKDEGKNFSGRNLRIFERGHNGEAMMIRWLRMAGFDLRTEKADGGQFGFSTAKGRIKGHCDGVFVAGPEEFGPYPRLWECKTMGAKGWNKMSREKIRKSNPEYWGQCQIYMAYMGLSDNPALFTALNADTMEIYAEHILFDPSAAQELSDKAVNVLQACDSGELLPRIAKSQDFFKCKWCSWGSHCWGLPS